MKKIYLLIYDSNDYENETFVYRCSYSDRRKAISSVIELNLELYENRDESYWNNIKEKIPNNIPKKNPCEIFEYIANAEEPPTEELDEGFYYICEILLEE